MWHSGKNKNDFVFVPGLQILDPLSALCGTFGMLLNISMPPFPHLQSGKDRNWLVVLCEN